MLAAGLVDVVLVVDCGVCPPADIAWLPNVVTVLGVVGLALVFVEVAALFGAVILEAGGAELDDARLVAGVLA